MTRMERERAEQGEVSREVAGAGGSEATTAEEQSSWRVVPVDQCAYGKRNKKPTKILTNMQSWEPAHAV